MADGLVAALAKAQANFGTIVKAHINPHFKSNYADLSDVLAVVRPCLNAEGVLLTQPVITDDDGRVRLYTILEGHGEKRESCLPLYLENMTPQQLLSTLTYYRRGMLAAMLAVAAEDDDDGNAAQTAPRASFQGLAATDKPEPEDVAQSREAVQEAIAGLTDADKELVKLEMRNQKVPSLKGPGATRAQLDGLVEFIAGLKERAEPFELNATTAEGRVMTSEGLGDAGVIPATEPTATVSETRPGEPASQTQPPFNPVRAARASLPGSQRKALDSSLRADK